MSRQWKNQHAVGCMAMSVHERKEKMGQQQWVTAERDSLEELRTSNAPELP